MTRKSIEIVIATVLVALAAILLGTAASAPAAGVAETRVGAFNVASEDPVGPPQHESPGQRLGEAADRVVTVVATGVAAKTVSGLSDDVVGLATRNITNSGDTVLGHFPGYITKANSKGASYFDIGDAWNGLTPSQRSAANTHFLDTRIAAGDRVLLSVPKGDIRPGSYLAQEVQYLTSNGYRWTNQWSLVPRG